MNQNATTKIQNLEEVGEDIGLIEGATMISSFRQKNPNATFGHYIGKTILTEILAQPGCVGINFRKGYDLFNQEHLVYTGVDENGKDILSTLAIEKSGQLIVKDGIVADKSIVVIEEDTFEEILRKILGS